ncbi:hypothetical protein [Vibrio sp. C8]
MPRPTPPKSTENLIATNIDEFRSKFSTVITENFNQQELDLFVDHTRECLTRLGPPPKKHIVQEIVAQLLNLKNFTTCRYHASDEYKLMNGELLEHYLQNSDCFRSLTVEISHKQKLTFSYPLATFSAEFLGTEIKFLITQVFATATNVVTTTFIVTPVNLPETTHFDCVFKNKLHCSLLQTLTETFTSFLSSNLTLRGDLSIEQKFLNAKILIDRAAKDMLEFKQNQYANSKKAIYAAIEPNIEYADFFEYLLKHYTTFEYNEIQVNKEYKFGCFKDHSSPIFEKSTDFEVIIETALDLVNTLISFAKSKNCYTKLCELALSDLKPDKKFIKNNYIKSRMIRKKYPDRMKKDYTLSKIAYRVKERSKGYI